MAEKVLKDIYDAPSVKHHFDSHVCVTLCKEGFRENHMLSNLRIAVGLITSALAVISHFAPIPFPDIIPLLIVCVSIYYFISGAHYLVSIFIEKDYFFQSHAKKIGKGNDVVLKIHSDFDTKSAVYSFTVEKLPGTESQSESLYIGDYLLEDGEFLTQDFRKLVRGVLRKLNAAD